ncbi:endo-alpha-N-acetylgalactosaminidase family protein [Melissococcus plutonius]|uniref:endo-alpha-N-acetylgalactosaminidase family protein n=1 Tax=Melissococcus plutonius TaxID=33970 RepID=UPI003C2C3500
MKKKQIYNLFIVCALFCIFIGELSAKTVWGEKNQIGNKQLAKKNDQQNEQANLWELDFSKGVIGNWQDIVGRTKREIVKDTLQISRDTTVDNNAVTINTDSPKLADGEVETRFKMMNGNARIGVVIRSTLTGNWVFVGYNNGNWLVEKPGAWNDTIKGPTLNENTTYIFKARYEGTKITMWLNGVEFYSGSPVLNDGSKLPINAGYIGVRTWYDNKIIQFDSFKNGSVNSIPEITPEIESIEKMSIYTKVDQVPILPEKVKAHYNTGTIKEVGVKWEAIDPKLYDHAGEFEVTGQVEGTTIPAKVLIRVINDGEVEKGKEIHSKDLAAIIDPNFPRILRYVDPKDQSLIFNGQTEKINKIVIDGTEYAATASIQNSTNDSATYTVQIPKINVTFDVVFTVSEGKEVKMEITHVKESDSLIHTILIPEQGLLSLNGMEPGAAFAGATMYTGKNTSNYNKTGDVFEDLTTNTKVEKKKYRYAFLNTTKYAASIWTNAYGDDKNDNEDDARIYKETKETEKGYITTLSSGTFTYRPYDGTTTSLTNDKPTIKVKFSGDLNGDNRVDWQDAAINYRSIMNNPKGGEKVPELVNQRIPFNFASQATNPFLTTLDETKRVYNLTDGLGQMVLLKGYQNEGHDSAHPDYGSIGLRPGGKEAINTLINEGHKLNAIFGAHINDTEAYPEAKSFNDKLVDFSQKGWDWLDSSYYINQRFDALTESRVNRLQALKKNVPNLDFIYVDVWGNRGESGWSSRQFAKEINQNGFILTNEFPNALEYDSIWNHWSADKNYGGDNLKGFNSTIVRFIRNHQKDTWVISDNPLLGGTELEAYEGWIGKINFNTYKEKTFSINIPTKFLQHYQIMKWDTKTAEDGQIHGTIQLSDHSNKVTVTDNNNSHERIITLNGIKVLQGKNYLLPWKMNGEAKFYHWNETGGETTWQLPNNFLGQPLHLYELTDQGRIDRGIPTIIGNQVHINAKAKTPYVLTANKQTKEIEFGSYTPIKDPGFNAKDTLKNNWKVEKGDPKIIKDSNGTNALVAGQQAMVVSQHLQPLAIGKYSVYINTETHNRQVNMRLAVDGKEYSSNFNRSLVQNYIQADANHTQGSFPQYMQKTRIDFEITKDNPNIILYLEAEKQPKEATMATKFNAIRVVTRQTDITNKEPKIVIKQDFEDTQAIGLYPFIKGEAGGVEDPRIHLSEKHEPYTQYGWNNNKISDVLNGNWSLKAHKQARGMMIQTTPQTIKFHPNEKYTISFDYQTDGSNNFYYGVFDKEFNNQEQTTWNQNHWLLAPTSTDGKTKHITYSVTGTANGDMMFGFYTAGGAYDLIIDNFKVSKD